MAGILFAIDIGHATKFQEPVLDGAHSVDQHSISDA